MNFSSKVRDVLVLSYVIRFAQKRIVFPQDLGQVFPWENLEEHSRADCLGQIALASWATHTVL